MLYAGMDMIQLSVSSEDKRKIDEMRNPYGFSYGQSFNFNVELHKHIDAMYKKWKSTAITGAITNRM